MKLLVTGGGGFLGRHLVTRATDQGHAVVLTSRNPRALQGLPPGASAEAVDLLDTADLERLLAEHRPDAVVHLAAVIDNHDPALLPVNVGGTRALTQALGSMRGAAPRLVFVSSFAVEDIPPTPYSESKLAAEEVVRGSSGPWVVVRPALIYGPGDPGNTAPLVASLAQGNHWLPAGGRTRIQPVFVEDAAAALLEAARRPGLEGRTYRLAGPEPVSVADFRTAVRDASGGRAHLRTLPLGLLQPAASLFSLLGKGRLAGIVAFHLADHAVDIEDATRDLDFRPRPLAEGLAATFELPL